MASHRRFPRAEPLTAPFGGSRDRAQAHRRTGSASGGDGYARAVDSRYPGAVCRLLERLFGEERRRTKVIPHPFGQALF